MTVCAPLRRRAQATMLCTTMLCLSTQASLTGCARGPRSGGAAPSQDVLRDPNFAGKSYAGDVERGKLVFETNCATCHGSGGVSGGVGPSLRAENARQDLARTIVWIENPDPPMPQLFPSPLSEEDVADVAAFVQQIR